jgi:TonB family protein
MFLAQLFLEVVATTKLRRLKAVPLPQDGTDPFTSVLGTAVAMIGLSKKRTPEVFWIPSNFRVAARVYGGFRSKLLVTGGLYAAVAKSRPEALCIVRHELAHIRNRDTRFYIIVMAFCILPLFLFVGIPDALLGIVSLVAVFLITVFLLRRREFIADAMAVNASESAEVYKQFLTLAAAGESSLFHPSVASRVRALSKNSRVLSFSLAFGTLVVLWTFAAMEQFFLLMRSRNDIQVGGVLTRFIFFVASVFSFLAVVFEFAKGFRRKIPAEEAQLEIKCNSRNVWIAAICLMNAWWWFLTMTFRILGVIWILGSDRVKPRPDIFQSMNQGSAICAAIGLIWFVVGFGLVRGNRWARSLGLGLAALSVAWQFYEAFHKEQLWWFGWYELFREEWNIVAPIFLLMIAGSAAVFFGLLHKKTPENFVVGSHRDSSVIGFATVGVSIAIIVVSISMPNLFAVTVPEVPSLSSPTSPEQFGPEEPNAVADVASQSNGTSLAEPASQVKKFVVGSGVMQELLLKRVEPIYPAGTPPAHGQREVVLQVTVDREGAVGDVRSISGDPRLVPAAITAVRQWRFKPYSLNGESVYMQSTVTVDFP